MAYATRRSSWLALALLAVGVPAHGKTPTSYHLFMPTRPRQAEEAQMVAQLAQRLAPKNASPLLEDGHLDAAAETLLAWAEAHPNNALPQGLARNYLLICGATEPAVALFKVEAASGAQILPALASAQARSPLFFAPTHLGFAARGGRAVLLVSRRLLAMAPVGKCAEVGEAVVVTGRTPNLRDRTLILGVQNSEGLILRRTLRVQKDTFRFVLQGPDTKGPLNIEVMGDVGQGIEIFNHFFVAPCGRRSAPEPILKSTPEAPPTVAYESEAAVQATLFDGIQELRARANMPPLQVSVALNQLAATRARNMRRTNHFAHRDAEGGDAQAHLQKAGFLFRWVFENLAVSNTGANALTQWKQSPLHLQNLLDARADTLGLGVAQGGEATTLWIVVLLTASH